MWRYQRIHLHQSSVAWWLCMWKHLLNNIRDARPSDVKAARGAMKMLRLHVVRLGPCGPHMAHRRHWGCTWQQQWRTHKRKRKSLSSRCHRVVSRGKSNSVSELVGEVEKGKSDWSKTMCWEIKTQVPLWSAEYPWKTPWEDRHASL